MYVWGAPAVTSTDAGRWKGSVSTRYPNCATTRELHLWVISTPRTDLIVWRGARVPSIRVLYWRTAKGQEVDFVVEHGERVLAIEVETSARPAPSAAATLWAFIEEYRATVHGALLLHDGHETIRLGESIVAAPWWRVI